MMMQLSMELDKPGGVVTGASEGADEQALMQTSWPSPRLVDDNFRMVLRNMQSFILR